MHKTYRLTWKGKNFFSIVKTADLSFVDKQPFNFLKQKPCQFFSAFWVYSQVNHFIVLFFEHAVLQILEFDVFSQVRLSASAVKPSGFSLSKIARSTRHPQVQQRLIFIHFSSLKQIQSSQMTSFWIVFHQLSCPITTVWSKLQCLIDLKNQLTVNPTALFPTDIPH